MAVLGDAYHNLRSAKRAIDKVNERAGNANYARKMTHASVGPCVTPWYPCCLMIDLEMAEERSA